MMLWFTIRVWLANRLIDLAAAVAPPELRAERERLRKAGAVVALIRRRRLQLGCSFRFVAIAAPTN
jgi:hypothetical protein